MAGHGIPTLREIRLRKEVIEGNYQSAIDVAEIDRGTAPEFLRDPVEFFKRTAMTPGVKELVVKTLMALLNLREATVGGTKYTIASKLFVVPSLFGGGKSHSLATLYHVVKVISSSRSCEEAYEKISVLDRDIAGFVKENWDKLVSIKPKIVLVHGEYSDYAPSPFDEKPVKSIWGYIADKLGEFQVMSRYDAEFIAPPVEALEKVLQGKGAVVLIDEIAYYYSRISTQGSPKYVDTVNSFLLGLSSMLGKIEVPSVAVVLTLPYNRDRGVVEKAHASILDVSTIKKILDRTRPEVIVVAKPEDLSSIIRKRVFDEDPARLERLGKLVAERILEEAPSDEVRSILVRNGLKTELSKTYPVHPETIETLKTLFSFLSEHLQLARSPIAIIIEAVKAVNQGCFDWMGFKPYLLMPHHIPVFDEQVLIANLPATEPELYRFKRILEEAVVTLGRGKDKCTMNLSVSTHISSESYAPPVYAMAVYIWLRSLPGRGLISNRDLYPTPEKITYAVLDLSVVRDVKWYDAKTTLEHEVKRLPHVNVIDGRWFFKWTPMIHELVKRYANDVTDVEVEEYLVKMIYDYFEDKEERSKQRILFTGKKQDMMVINGLNVSGENATVVIYTHAVNPEELKIPYNNVILLVPDTTTKISPEEARLYEVPSAATYWDALRHAIRFVIVCGEKLRENDLYTIYKDEIERDSNLKAILKNQLNEIHDKYKNRTRELFTKVYNSIRLRQSKKPIRITYPQRFKPLFDVIEETLVDKYIIKDVYDDWVIKLAEALGLDTKSPDGISLNSLWRYLLTGENDKIVIPIATLDWFVQVALKPVKTLDYAVVSKDKVHWKHVYSSRADALQALESSEKKIDTLPDTAFTSLATTVKALLRQGEEARLVHYTHIWKKWVEQELRSLHGEVLVMTDGKHERVLDLETIKNESLMHTILKGWVVFKEKPKVKVDVEYPRQIEPGAKASITVKASSQVVKDAKLKITVSNATPGSIEKNISIPSQQAFEDRIELTPAEDAREIRVSIVVEDPDGKTVLGRGEAVVMVNRPVVAEAYREEKLTVEELKALGDTVTVEEIKEIEVTRTEDYFRIISVFRELSDKASVTASFDRLRLETSGDIGFDETQEVMNSIIRLKDKFTLTSLSVRIRVADNMTRRTDVIKKLPGTVRIKVVLRENRGESK